MTSFQILRALNVLSDLIELITTAAIATYVVGAMASEAFHAWHADWVSAPVFLPEPAPVLLLPPAPEPVALLASAHAAVELPSTVVGLRALARAQGLPSQLWKSARKADLITLLS